MLGCEIPGMVEPEVKESGRKEDAEKKDRIGDYVKLKTVTDISD